MNVNTILHVLLSYVAILFDSPLVFMTVDRVSHTYYVKELSTMICRGNHSLPICHYQLINVTDGRYIISSFQVCLLCRIYAMQWQVWRK